MREFKGKTAVVTGAASGMGRAFATRFAAEGMRVVLADIEERALARAVDELRHDGAQAIGVRTDVSSAAAIQQLASEALEAFGGIHVVCNNAGVEGYLEGAIWEAQPKDWEWTMGVDFWGVVHGVRTFLPILLAQDEPGHIVNTASTMGFVRGTNMYGIAKHAVVALSEAVYGDLRERKSKVGISVLSPGMVNTQLFHGNRNRPAALRAEVDAETEARGEQIRAHFTSQLQKAADPAGVAETLLRAISDEQFYIFTDTDWDADIRQRVDQVLARKNPVLGSTAYQEATV
jgi:NAD(P)-dependent dehydrogenase (short-subunit alcohol dehydrogenase family)